MNIELGKYALFTTPLLLLRLKKETFVNVLQNNYSSVSSLPLEDGQIKAWENCYDVLKAVLPTLPYSFRNLWLIFEYVLPLHNPSSNKFLNENHIIADMVLISADTAVVLEFKQRSDTYFGMFRQAKKYQNRLINFHVESINMSVKSLLVLTKAKEYTTVFEEVPACSPDLLRNQLVNFFGSNPQRKQKIERWINSDFAGMVPQKQEILDKKNRNVYIKRVFYEKLEFMIESKRIADLDRRIELMKADYSSGKLSLNDYNKLIRKLKIDRNTISLALNDNKDDWEQLQRELQMKDQNL